MELFDEDRIGTAQKVGVFLLHFAQNAHAQAWAWERVAVHHLAGQAKRHAEFTHFVFEQFAQWLQELQAQLLGQAAHVVVALDRHGFFALRAAAFNHVRVNRTLGQERGAFDGRSAVNAMFSSTGCFELGRLFFEHIDKQTANDFPFGFWLAHASQLTQEQVTRIHANHVGVQLAHKHVHHHVAFIQAQQAMVHKHAGEFVANGAVYQGCGHGRIHTARQAQNNFFVAHLLANGGNRFFDVVAHDPVGACAANIQHKAVQQGLALHGMRDFGVKLHRVKIARFVRHACDGASGCRCHDLEAFGQLGHFVAVAHPHFEHAVALRCGEVFNAFE